MQYEVHHQLINPYMTKIEPFATVQEAQERFNELRGRCFNKHDSCSHWVEIWCNGVKIKDEFSSYPNVQPTKRVFFW